MKQGSILLAPLAAACILGTEPDLGGMPIHDVSLIGDLVLTARADAGEDTLQIVIAIHNRGAARAELHMGYCSFAIRGVSPYRVTWDNRLRGNEGCPDVQIVLPVEPGATRERLVWRFVRAWGTLPPPGQYGIVVYYREAGRLRHVSAGSVTRSS